MIGVSCVSVVLALVLGLACSPRHGPTPATKPRERERQPAGSAPVLLAAEPVAEASITDKPTPPERVELGYASVEYGERPPWMPIDSANGDTIVASEGGHRLQDPWRLYRTIRVGRGYLHQAELSPEGSRVLTVSAQEGALRAYDVESAALRHKLALPGFGEFDSVGFAAMDPLQQFVLVVRQPFNVRSEQAAAEVLPLLVDLERATFTPVLDLPPGDGLRHSERPGLFGITLRVLEPQSGNLSLWWISLSRAADGSAALDVRLALRLSCRERPDDWALSKDGKLLALAYYPSNVVELLDLEQRRVLLRLPAPEWGGSVALSPDSSLLALGGAQLSVHSVPGGEELASDSRYKNNIDTIRFTPGSELLLVSAYDGKARSYALPEKLGELDALPRPQVLAHHGANVYALALTQDGRRLVTSSGDQTLKVWVR